MNGSSSEAQDFMEWFCGPLKMRRVPQEAVFGTECVFRTVEGCFWYRVPSKEQGKGPPETSSALTGPKKWRKGPERTKRAEPSQRQGAAAAELRTSQSRRVRDFHPIGYVRSGRTKKEADKVDLFFCIGSQQEMITLLKQLL